MKNLSTFDNARIEFPMWVELQQKNRTSKQEAALVEAAKKFLPDFPFFYSGGMACCKAPYGDYYFGFCVEIKQEQIWNYKEFQEGCIFGLSAPPFGRDANPYAEPSRRRSSRLWLYPWISRE